MGMRFELGCRTTEDGMQPNDTPIIAVDPRQTSSPEELPWTFAVHDEGEGLFALYISPFDPADLVETLAGCDDRWFAVSARWGVQAAESIHLEEVALRTAPLEIVHVPTGTPHASVALLAAPHRVLEDNSAVGVSISDDDHAVIFCRSTELLEDMIRGYLASRLRDTGVSDITIPDAVGARLATPLQDAEWQNAALHWHRGHPVLWTSRVHPYESKAYPTRWLLSATDRSIEVL